SSVDLDDGSDRVDEEAIGHGSKPIHVRRVGEPRTQKHNARRNNAHCALFFHSPDIPRLALYGGSQ
ncbi:MAG: hypothetical protein K0Q52_3526, partial [Microbacterium sp.]|nr:hypothetical protein [Microbacterium sp.]